MNYGRLLLLLLICGASAATAQTPDLRGCRGLPDASTRLACYDALPLPPASVATALRPPNPTPAPAAAAPGTGESSFGLDAPTRGEVAAVHSTVPGRFEGWGPRSRIRLANGQVWEVTDGSRSAVWLLDPQVVVRRAALGSFMMEVAGLKLAARVQRVE